MAEPWVAELLSVWREAQRRSMVGPRDPVAHLDRARDLADAIDPPSLALDLGSGAGIPGLALAGFWPRSTWALVDTAQRRVELLRAAVDRLGWGDRVAVLHGRAEDLGRLPAHRERYQLVTARSFGPPAVTAECGSPFVQVGGVLAVTEPPVDDASRWPAPGVALVGLEPGRRAAGARLLSKVATCPEQYPRRPGIPAKRPLY